VSTWIVDASPLILLGKIHRLDLLVKLCPSFVIPTAVSLEILAGPDSDPFFIQRSMLPRSSSISRSGFPLPLLMLNFSHAHDSDSGKTPR
jgi:hypothetical protein